MCHCSHHEVRGAEADGLLSVSEMGA
jgi:hypothetical protein